MGNRNRIYIVIALGLVVIVGSLVSLFSSPSTETMDNGFVEFKGVKGDPLDITLDFFDAWLMARQSTSTDPYQENLISREGVSVALGEKLLAAETAFRESGFDPVLCQNALPEKFRARVVYEDTTSAQMLIMPKEKEGGVQSVVSLIAQGELWEISDISCGSGEQAPEMGEFSFDRTGFLLRQSVQPPLDPELWHLVFEQDGVLGYTAPLFFGAGSVCVINGDEESCDTANLAEVMQVAVQGQMTEAGVEVARVELVGS
jgi:hypothetical protein